MSLSILEESGKEDCVAIICDPTLNCITLQKSVCWQSNLLKSIIKLLKTSFENAAGAQQLQMIPQGFPALLLLGAAVATGSKWLLDLDKNAEKYVI